MCRHDLPIGDTQELREMILRKRPGRSIFAFRGQAFQPPGLWSNDETVVVQPGQLASLGNLADGTHGIAIHFVRIEREDHPLSILALRGQVVAVR